MVAIERLENAGEAERSAIIEPLGEHARVQGMPWNPQHVVLALTDIGGIRGGLIGFIQWDWLYIEILAIQESLRGHGWGRRLVETAERIAVDAASRGLWVSTFTFQAPGLYERLGFVQCGRIDDYPAGHSRLFYKKDLAQPGQS